MFGSGFESRSILLQEGGGGGGNSRGKQGSSSVKLLRLTWVEDGWLSRREERMDHIELQG